MTFLTPILLWGLALGSIPVILHLCMKRKPKVLLFPALRFLQSVNQNNRQWLRLRHWLLLTLRTLLIIVLVLLMARPSVNRAISAVHNGPVAAALVFDTSLRLNYLQNNQTRLEHSQAEGNWILSRLPAESQIAVLDSLTSEAAFSVDRSAAKFRIDKLQTGPNARPLSSVVAMAAGLLKTSDNPARELYLFTDLSRAAWPEDAAVAVQHAVAGEPGIAIHIIDTGATNIVNDSLENLHLSNELITATEPIVITADVSRQTSEGIPLQQRKVELFVTDYTGKLQKRDERILTIDKTAPEKSRSQSIRFTVRGFESAETDTVSGVSAENSAGTNADTGIHTYQGFVRIDGSDALPDDDCRYFSFSVRSAGQALIITSDTNRNVGVYIEQALSPTGLRKSGKNRYRCTTITQSELAQPELTAGKLSSFDVIFLLDPEPMADAGWKKLFDWTASGKGLAILLGSRAVPIESFNGTEPQKLLPGTLFLQARAGQNVLYPLPRNFNHPILLPMARYRANTVWTSMPVFRYWQFDQFATDVNTVLRLNDLRPLILERSVGLGNCLTVTTPFGEDVNAAGPSRLWNSFTSSQAWPVFVLINQMADYLYQTHMSRLNYTAGQLAIVPLDRTAPDSFMVSEIGSQTEIRVQDQDGQKLLTVPSPMTSCNVVLTPNPPASSVRRGLSYNYAPGQTQIERISEDQLRQFLGTLPFTLNRQRVEIEHSLAGGRIGYELFPWLILMLVGLIAVEELVSNLFYRV